MRYTICIAVLVLTIFLGIRLAEAVCGDTYYFVSESYDGTYACVNQVQDSFVKRVNWSVKWLDNYGSLKSVLDSGTNHWYNSGFNCDAC